MKALIKLHKKEWVQTTATFNSMKLRVETYGNLYKSSWIRDHISKWLLISDASVSDASF